MNKDIQPFLIEMDTQVRQAMKQLEESAHKTLFVINSNSQLVGTLTDGDIRRWILKGGSLKDTIEQVCNRNPYYVRGEYNLPDIKQEMLSRNIHCVPVVNHEAEITELIFWEAVFKEDGIAKLLKQIDIPVVIMAGGKGARLDPFTKILPKPLIPIGDRSIIEIIIDSFLAYGVNKFYISVNYKSKIIKAYFEELAPSYFIEYVHEDKPLGTAGSLKYLSGKIKSSFIVTNCDILIHSDYSDLVDFHTMNSNDITVVASMKNYHIPYGICEIENGGALIRITEKPEYNFLVNTGMYILSPEILSLIPDNEIFHMTDLISVLKEKGRKVGVFPISENSWLDTGEWAEYKKTLEHLKLD